MFENNYSFLMATTMLMGLYGADKKEKETEKTTCENK